jgi:hypothetical protein
MTVTTESGESDGDTTSPRRLPLSRAPVAVRGRCGIQLRGSPGFGLCVEVFILQCLRVRAELLQPSVVIQEPQGSAQCLRRALAWPRGLTEDPFVVGCRTETDACGHVSQASACSTDVKRCNWYPCTRSRRPQLPPLRRGGGHCLRSARRSATACVPHDDRLRVRKTFGTGVPVAPTSTGWANDVRCAAQLSNINQQISLRRRWSSMTRSRTCGGSWARCHTHSRRRTCSASAPDAAARAALMA